MPMTATCTCTSSIAQDPLINAYQHLFPELFSPASAMPAGLREHARAPEMLFRAQAEIYRTYHMRDPESYYNRADLWDLATFTTGAGRQPQPVPPTYMIAQLPGEKEPEFLLMIQFTPRNKQNLIGLMAARCDGEHLGELVFLQLPKQEVFSGPAASGGADQSGSEYFEGLDAVEPARLAGAAQPDPDAAHRSHLLYVAPIYIQAAQARMPQLRKVALVRGSTLIYADTYEQALAQLQAVQGGKPVQILTPAASPGSPGRPDVGRPRQSPTRASTASACTSNATANSPPKANGPTPVKSWKPSNPP